MILFKNAKKFFRLRLKERNVFVLCLTISTIAAIIIQFFPLKLYYRILQSNPVNKISESEVDHTISIMIKAMRRVEKIAFWKCNCLNQVLTLKFLCNQKGIPSTVKLILSNLSSGEVKAHASLVFLNKLEYLAPIGRAEKYAELCIN